MPYTGAENAVTIQATQNLVENDPEIIQVHGHIPEFPIDGGFVAYARVPKLIEGSPAGSCLPIKDHSDAATQVKFGLVDYATRFVICDADEDTLRIPNSPENNEDALAEIKLEYGFYAAWTSAPAIPSMVACRTWFHPPILSTLAVLY